MHLSPHFKFQADQSFYTLRSIEKIIAHLPAYRPQPPWFGPHLQTLYNKLNRLQFQLHTYPQGRLLLPLNDGSGEANNPIFASLSS